jgi:hypothetical protein
MITEEDADNARIESEVQLAKHLGSIRVCFWRTLEAGISTYKPIKQEEVTTFELAVKSLKGRAIAHGTGFAGD